MTPSRTQASPGATARAAKPRTFTESLRALDQSALVALLRSRPDLCYPLPADLSDLAARAATATSIGRLLDRLDHWQRAVAEALAALPDPVAASEVAELLGAEQAMVDEALDDLRLRGICWGGDRLHLLRSARDYFGSYPYGLAPPSPHPLSARDIDSALEQSGADVGPALERLAWGPPTGTVRNATRPIDSRSASTPIERLLAHRLLRPVDTDTVILPREVALRLRDGRLTRDPISPRPPGLTGRIRPVGLIDKAAAGGAFGLLHDLELVAHTLEHTPHRLLRTGGLAARDVTALARNLGTDVPQATFVVECLAAAGLAAPGDQQTLLPTAGFDRWVAMDAAPRWHQIVAAWATAARQFSAAGVDGAHALGPEAESSGAPSLRRLIMDQASEAEPGTVIDIEELTAVVGWHRPRLGGTSDLRRLVGWTWQEAAWLGLTALEVMASFAAVAQTSDEEIPEALVDLFPAPVDQLIIQADLTAVAPGPLPHHISSDLRMLADQESRGGGGVYRFSAATLRRALDAGWAAADIHAWLAEHATTAVPQPLAYLVDDVARLHGSVRVGTAVSYVRTDEAHAAVILAEPGTAALGLRALAPGVLVSMAEPDEVVDTLRRLGLSPSAEDSRGRAMTAPSRRRAPVPRRTTAPATVSADEVAATIVAVEEQHSRGERARLSTDETMARLAAAIDAEDRVRVVFVGSDGAQVERDLSPLGLGSGLVRAVDLTTSQVITIPLARISSVRANETDH